MINKIMRFFGYVRQDETSVAVEEVVKETRRLRSVADRIFDGIEKLDEALEGASKHGTD